MIVQDAEEIVKFTEIRSPYAWRVFWGKVRILLPLLVFCAVCLIETVGLSASRFGRSWTEILPALIAPTILISMPFVVLACTTFRCLVSRQRVEIGSEGIKTLDRNPMVVPWERVGRLSLSKLPGASGVSVFSIGYTRAPGTSFFTKLFPGLHRPPPSKLSSRQLTWIRLILLNPQQTGSLRKGIDFLGVGNSSIPLLRELRSMSLAASWLSVFAMYLLLHGAPLLGVGLEKHHQPSKIVEQVVPGREDKMATVVGPTLARHFRNERQLQTFLIVTGASLTAAGIGFYSASFLLMRRKPSSI